MSNSIKTGYFQNITHMTGGKIIIALSLILLVCGIAGFLLLSAKPTTLTDPSAYGVYSESDMTDEKSKLINSVMPAKLEPFFDVVSYSYTEINDGTHSFEIFLEVRIKDTAVFDEYTSSLASEDEWEPFTRDNSYLEYAVCNTPAELGVILFSREEQTVIFTARGVYSGCENASALNAFSSRFGG